MASVRKSLVNQVKCVCCDVVALKAMNAIEQSQVFVVHQEHAGIRKMLTLIANSGIIVVHQPASFLHHPIPETKDQCKQNDFQL